MSKGTTITFVIIAVVIAVLVLATYDFDATGGALPSANVDVTKTEEGSLPKYDIVKTQEGNLPKYDVDADVSGGKMPDVDVTAPDVDVKTETKTVEVPVGVEATTGDEKDGE